MGLPKQAIDSIVKLSAKERLDYSIKTISGIETLYLLNGKDDWICLKIWRKRISNDLSRIWVCGVSSPMESSSIENRWNGN